MLQSHSVVVTVRVGIVTLGIRPTAACVAWLGWPRPLRWPYLIPGHLVGAWLNVKLLIIAGDLGCRKSLTYFTAQVFRKDVRWATVSWYHGALSYFIPEPKHRKQTFVDLRTTVSVMVYDVMKTRIFDTSHDHTKYNNKFADFFKYVSYSGNVTAHKKPQIGRQ